MVLFRYVAQDATGRTVTGATEAGTPAEARASLRATGLHATRLEQTVGLAKGSRSILAGSGHRLDQLAAFCRHLAMLLKAGVPLAQALEVMAGQLEDPKFSEAARDLGVRVREGRSLDMALAAHPAFFPELLVSIARAGAASGNLGQALGEVAAFYLRQKKLRDRLITALTYPFLMASVGILVLIFLLTFVVPKVTAVLLEQQRALPWPTEVLLAVSGFFQEYWWLALIAVALSGWMALLVLRTRKGRRAWDGLVLALPVVGDLVRKQAIARWADTLGNLVASGIPVAQGLSLVRGALGNLVLADEVLRMEQGVIEGRDLSDLLKGSLQMPPSVGFVVAVGEESGELAMVLRELASGYHDEVEVVSTRLAELVNPVLIVFLGLAVGFIVAAILLPITDFAQVN